MAEELTPDPKEDIVAAGSIEKLPEWFGNKNRTKYWVRDNMIKTGKVIIFKFLTNFHDASYCS